MFMHQEFRTKNDTNGNPRRLIVVWQTKPDQVMAELVVIYKAAYGDPSPKLRRKLGVRLEMVRIEPSEYRRLLKVAEATDKLEYLD